MGEKTRILIVAGEVSTTLTEQEIIIDLGYELMAIVFSEESAIQLASRDRPDLVLVDLSFGSGMDGREAALKIHELHQIPVIFVIDFGAMEPSEVGGFTKPEGFGLVSKPFTAEELESEIKRLID